MTFTYSSTDLSTTLAQVRRLIGDTSSSDAQLTDEEIDFFTDNTPSQYYAAASCAEAIAAGYARRVSKTVGPLSIQLTDRQTTYLTLAGRLRQQAAVVGGITPYAGGISVDDKETVASDTDRFPPLFSKGMEDAPGTNLSPVPSTAYPNLD